MNVGRSLQGQVQGGRQQKRSMQRQRLFFWNGGVYEEAGSTEYESAEKIAGQEFSLCSESVTCSVCKVCMRLE